MGKIVITVFITIIFLAISILYALGIITPLIQETVPSFIVIIVALIFIAVMLTLIYTMIKRIKEIKRGDEDDLSKY